MSNYTPRRNCDDCYQNLHISCNCLKENKITVIKLQFMKSQRDKICSKGEMQTGSVNKKEATKQKKYQESRVNQRELEKTVGVRICLQ